MEKEFLEDVGIESSNEYIRAEQKENAKKTFKGIGISLTAMAVVTLIVQIVYAGIINALKPELASASWYAWSTVFLGFHLCGFPVYLLLMKKLPDVSRKEETPEMDFGVGKIIKYVLICLSVTYIFNIATSLLLNIVSLLKGSQVVNPIAATVSASGIVYTVLVGCIIVPIIEEVVFRGVLINKLKNYDDKTIIWFSGIVFGLFHMNLNQFFYATVLGMVFAYVTLKTKSIKHAIILHVIVNLFGTTILPTLLSGGLELVALAGFLIIGIMIVGLILGLKERKFAVLDNGDLPKVEKSIKYWNIGMLPYMIICIVSIIAIIFMM